MQKLSLQSVLLHADREHLFSMANKRQIHHMYTVPEPVGRHAHDTASVLNAVETLSIVISAAQASRKGGSLTLTMLPCASYLIASSQSSQSDCKALNSSRLTLPSLSWPDLSQF